MEIPDGLIEPNKNAPFGFSLDFFYGYLWKEKNSIYLSLIISRYPGKGNFKKLVNSILLSGFTCKVPNPLFIMKYILEKWGFKKTYEYVEIAGEDVEVYTKK
jgi:hypothetical protein